MQRYVVDNDGETMTYDDWKLDTPPYLDDPDEPEPSEPGWDEDDYAADAAERWNDDHGI